MGLWGAGLPRRVRRVVVALVDLRGWDPASVAEVVIGEGKMGLRVGRHRDEHCPRRLETFAARRRGPRVGAGVELGEKTLTAVEERRASFRLSWPGPL